MKQSNLKSLREKNLTKILIYFLLALLLLANFSETRLLGSMLDNMTNINSKPFIKNPTKTIFGHMNIYYVDIEKGNDYNPGNINNPWKNIYFAFLQLKAGDTLYIREGQYNTNPNGDMLYLTSSGSKNNRIVIMPYQNEKVVINGSNMNKAKNGGWASIIHLWKKDYITIENLILENSENFGIFFNGQNTIIKNNLIRHTGGSGIYASNGTDSIIEGNEVYSACEYGQDESISLYMASNIDIKYNYVHHNGNLNHHKNGIAIDIKNGSKNINIYGNIISYHRTNGIYVDSRGFTSNINIYNNIVSNCGGRGIVIASETSREASLMKNVKIYNNIVFNCLQGISIGFGLMPPNPLQDIVISNNISYNNIEYGLTIDTNPGNNPSLPHAKRITIVNNIFSKNRKGSLWKNTNVVFNEYTIINNIEDGIGNFSGKDSIYKDPLFMNPKQGNFNLSKNSPAIGTGNKKYNMSITSNRINIGLCN